MKDKELLLEAIDNYDLYSQSLRMTLHALLDLSIDNITSISPTELSRLIKIGRGVIYYNLRILSEDGIIKKAGKKMSNQSRPISPAFIRPAGMPPRPEFPPARLEGK